MNIIILILCPRVVLHVLGHHQDIKNFRKLGMNTIIAEKPTINTTQRKGEKEDEMSTLNEKNITTGIFESNFDGFSSRHREQRGRFYDGGRSYGEPSSSFHYREREFHYYDKTKPKWQTPTKAESYSPQHPLGPDMTEDGELLENTFQTPQKHEVEMVFC
jgi:hypothetical protein